MSRSTIFMHPASPNSQAVVMAAIHAGRDFRLEIIDLFAGEQNDEAFVALNPNCMVPVLREGDFILWEANAIAQYLAASSRLDSFWPHDKRARADIARWQFWSLAHWTPALQPFVFENLFKGLKGLGSPSELVLREARVKFDRFAGVLDRRLGAQGWLSGPSATLSDVFVASYLVYAEPAQIPLQGFANIQRWYRSFTELPSWKAMTERLQAIGAK